MHSVGYFNNIYLHYFGRRKDFESFSRTFETRGYIEASQQFLCLEGNVGISVVGEMNGWFSRDIALNDQGVTSLRNMSKKQGGDKAWARQTKPHVSRQTACFMHEVVACCTPFANKIRTSNLKSFSAFYYQAVTDLATFLDFRSEIQIFYNSNITKNYNLWN